MVGPGGPRRKKNWSWQSPHSDSDEPQSTVERYHQCGHDGTQDQQRLNISKGSDFPNSESQLREKSVNEEKLMQK